MALFEAVFGLVDGALVGASKDPSRVGTVGVARRLRLGAKGLVKKVWCKCNIIRVIKAVNRKKCSRQHLKNIS